MSGDDRAERRARIARLYEGGMLIKDIAAEVGLAANTVGVIIKEMGYERPAKPQKRVKAVDDADQCAVLMWDQGYSTSAISERLRLCRASVRRALRDAGRDIYSARRQRYDGVGGSARRSGNAFARIARRT